MTAGRKAFAVILAIGLLTTGAGGETRHDADVLVALGAGVAGTWETEFDFANNESLPLSVFAGEQPNEFVCVTSPCGIAYATLPRTGSARIVATPADFGRFTGRLFVGAHDAEELPAVRARVVNRARPSQAIELPLFRRSTLVALDPRVLAFPSAVRTAGAHTNLFVSEIELANALSVLVEVYSPAGEQLGQRTIALAPGVVLVEQAFDHESKTRRDLSFGDEIIALGVAFAPQELVPRVLSCLRQRRVGVDLPKENLVSHFRQPSRLPTRERREYDLARPILGRARWSTSPRSAPRWRHSATRAGAGLRGSALSRSCPPRGRERHRATPTE